MPRMYSATVRRQIVSRLRSGEAVAAVAAETGICQATLFRWKRQALIDAGVIEGTPSVEADELAAAHKRIAQLEAELALTRDACELFNAEAVVPPKRRRAIVEGLIARGHSARLACRISGLARSLLQYYRRRPVPDRQIRRLIVADTITEIHQRSRGTYGGRRIRAALLADYDMNVNLKLVRSIMGEHGLYGLPHPPRRLPNLIRVNTPDDLVNRQFTAARASFGTVGDCYDNAAMESFWARLQVELLNTRKWATTPELAAAMADYIDNFYNVERRHSYLGNISPTEYETLWTSTYSVPQLA
jgi:putative transposase